MEHTPRRIVANTALYTGTLVVQKAIAFLYFWFLSSRLQPELLGTYIWALSLTTLFSVGVDLGLSPLLIREATRDANRAERLLRATLGLKILFGLATLLLLGAVLIITKRDPAMIAVVGVAALVMIFDSFSMSLWSVMRARQIVSYESAGMLAFHVLVFALGAYLLSIKISPLLAMAALATGSGTMFLFSLVVMRVRFRFRASPSFDRATFRFLLGLLPAFAVAGIFVRIYNAADTILLGFLAGSVAVGLYSVPAKVVTALAMLVPGAFVASIYPAMSHYYKTSRVELAQLFERSLGYLGLVVFPMTVALVILIPRILRVIWPEYLTVAPAFLLMVLGLPFLFFTFPTGYLLNASDRQRANTMNRGIATALNITMNVALIPFFGVMGAGIAFLATNGALFFLDIRKVWQIIPLSWDWLRLLFVKSMAGTALMAVALIALPSQTPLLIVVLAGIFVYGVVLVALRTFSREEIIMVRGLFRRGNSFYETSPPFDT